MNADPLADYVTVAAAARMLKLSRQGVYYQIRHGMLPGATQFAGRWFVPRSTLRGDGTSVDVDAAVSRALDD